MAGIAVATIVWSMAAMNMPTMRPENASMIWRWVSEPGARLVDIRSDPSSSDVPRSGAASRRALPSQGVT